jgi:signal transduction histidine kinase
VGKNAPIRRNGGHAMKKIAVRLWGGMMALVAIILILLWFFQIVFLNSFYTRIRINEIENSGRHILKQIDNGDQFRNSLDKLAYDNNMTAELYDLNGNTVYITGATGMNGMMPMMRSAARAEVLGEAAAGKMKELFMTHPRFNSKFILIGLPVGLPGKVEGALLLTLPLAPVEETVNILKRQFVYITILLLAATLLISFLLSRSFTKPILDITKVSMAMAAGNLSARINIKRKDEIGRLAETINYMGNELSKTEQLRKDLVANVSHELRTPLSLIKGYAETIRDVSGNNTEKREKQINIIIEESDRLSGIVEDILNLSQMQAGYVNLRQQRIKLDDMLKRLVKKYEILGEKTGVSISMGEIPEVFAEGDEARIEQVICNLMNNAFNHTPEGSAISINTNETADKVRIEVNNPGEGIPPDELINIWERFYKVDKTGKRNRAGTGLGLAIVKSILEAHKASFGAVSQPDSGTTFWFELKKCND